MENAQVFISYHTSSSAHTVRQIATALESRGVSCWYAPRDAEGDYATSIVRAINHCRVFLVILNQDSNLSEDVRNEINCAFERFRRHEDIVLLPFRMDDCVLSDAVQYYLGRIHIMDGSVPPEIVRIQELIDRVCGILGKAPERTAVVSDGGSGSRQYRLIGSMIYADNQFVGRAAELEQIHRVLTGRDNKLLLVGMGGIGKSEIAKTFCARFRDDYDVMLWVSFEGSLLQTVINDFSFPIQGLERSDYPKDSDRDYFRRKLKILKTIADPRVLIVVDNFDVPSDPDLEEFCGISCGVLFTTRFRGISRHLQETEISAITDEGELLELFRTEYTRAVTSDAAVRELLQTLDGHPLSIRLVASTMHSRRITPEKMLALLRDGITAMKQRNAKAADIIYSRLQQVFSLASLTEMQITMLKTLSLIPICGIAVDQLFEWCEWNDFDIIDDLIQKSWIVHNPATDVVHLHPIIAKVFRDEVQNDPACCLPYIHRLIEASRTTKLLSWKELQQLVDFCETACAHFPDAHVLKDELTVATGSVLMDIGWHGSAYTIFQNLLNRTADSEMRLFLYHKLSHIEVLTNNPRRCVQTAEEGCAFLRTLDMDKLSIDAKYMKKVLLQRLGEAYRKLQDYERAVDYGRQAVAVCDEYVFRDPELSRGWALYHLAASLFGAGNTGEAMDTINHAIQLFEIITDDWSIAFCLTLKNQLLLQMKHCGEALDCIDRAMDLHRYHYGDRSQHSAELLVNKGDTLYAMGRIADADMCYNQAAEILRSLGHQTLADEIVRKMQQDQP